MGWKTRKGRLYFYTSTRVGDRVVSTYEGPGEAGRLAAGVSRLMRMRREMDRAKDLERIRVLTEMDGELSRFHQGVRVVFRASMELAGWHRQKRGRWRLARQKTELATNEAAAAPPPARRARPRGPELAVMQEIMTRANDGDATVLPELKKLLASDWHDSILSHVGDPSEWLAKRYIKRISLNNLGLEHVFEAQRVDLEQSLAPPGSPALERLLASWAVVNWLAAHEAQKAELDNLVNGSPRVCEVLQRRADRAHARFLEATRALTALRKALGAPAVASVSRTETVTFEAGKGR